MTKVNNSLIVFPAKELVHYGATYWNVKNGGPLVGRVAKSFRECYIEQTLSAAASFYRVYGGKASRLGKWYTTEWVLKASEKEIKEGLALSSKWGNKVEKIEKRVFPPGTKIYKGFAAPQDNLSGGKPQIYTP